MKRLLLALTAALALTLGAVASPAAATHPQVSGIGTCNPQTGLFDVVWTVTSDPGYDATGVFVSADRLADQIVGQAVAGYGAAISPAPVESVATSAPLSLTVGIQFSNHRDGDIVSNTGSAVFLSESCEKELLEVIPVYPGVVDECGTTNDGYTAPANSEGITYTLVNGDLIATFADGYKWGTLPDGYVDNLDGTATFPLTATLWTDEPCSTPTPTDPPKLPVTGDEGWAGLLIGLGLAIGGGGLLMTQVRIRRAAHRA